jgi:hypothetical protein
MMMAKKIVITMTILLLAVPFCFARAKRPNQIPNGTKFSCLNCHFGQGGVRNTFGQMVESGYLTVPGADGDVVWGNALALLEADGDGFSNGTELQDPDGTWSIGNPNPGTSSLVTNPGDSKSKPTSAVGEGKKGLVPGSMELDQNYPNPFNASTRIRIHLPYRDRLRLRIFDLSGATVWEAERTVDSPGEIEMNWDGNDRSQKPLGSGVYLLAVQSSREILSTRMMLIK